MLIKYTSNSPAATELLMSTCNVFPQCLTIFSASNYYGPGSNRGAYVILQGAELRPHFVQFSAQTKSKYISMRQRVGALEASALNELRNKILASKQVLLHEFKKRDPLKKGTLDRRHWRYS